MKACSYIKRSGFIMGLTPALLLLLGLLAPQFSGEPVVYEECDVYDSYYECEDDIDDYGDPLSPDETSEMSETFSFDGFEYTIKEAYFADATEFIDEYNLDFYGEPENLLVINFEYTNIGESVGSPAYYLSMYGDNFIVAEYGRMNSVPEINPGRSGHGQLMYDVPDGVELLELEISALHYSDNSIKTVEIVVEEE